MKVAHFNTYAHGGAANAAHRIHSGLRQLNIDSQVHYLLSDIGPPQHPHYHQLQFLSQSSPPGLGWLGKRRLRKQQKMAYRLYDRDLAGRDEKLETFSMAQLPEPTRLNWSEIKADVVHLHWIAYMADYQSFFQSIPDSVPIVWTLHDTNPFTGGCHYNGGCQRFQGQCGQCPQLADPLPEDVSNHSIQVKQAALANKQIHVVSPCNWMKHLAESSSVWPRTANFHTIHYGLDLEAFHPVAQVEARLSLDLPLDKTLVAFGADDVTNPRKGMQHLLAALKRLEGVTGAIECVLFGAGQFPLDENLPKIHELGYIESRDQQRAVYAAADLVVVPSLEDNQPQVGLEAMACGVPVIAFDAGGLRQYVRHGETGLLVRLEDEVGLARAIECLCGDKEKRIELGQNGLEMVRSEFELLRQSQKYVDLYRSVYA